MRKENGILVPPNGRNVAHGLSFQPVGSSQLTAVHHLIAEATGAGDKPSRFLQAVTAPAHNRVGFIAYVARPLAGGAYHDTLRSASDARFRRFTGL